MNPENLHPINMEDVENAKKEAESEISQIGELPTSNLPSIPDKEKLDQLKKMIDSLPPDRRAQLLANLASANGNVLNPNNNSYSTVSGEDVLKQKLKRKLQEKKYGRVSSQVKNHEKQKYITKMQEYQKQKEVFAKQLQEEQTAHDNNKCKDDCKDHDHTN